MGIATMTAEEPENVDGETPAAPAEEPESEPETESQE
jgi:hypothetical protein